MGSNRRVVTGLPDMKSLLRWQRIIRICLLFPLLITLLFIGILWLITSAFRAILWLCRELWHACLDGADQILSILKANRDD